MPHAPHSHRPFDGFSDDAVDRFLAGESTPEEQERFQAYLARNARDVAWTELFADDEQRFASDVTAGNAQAQLEARLRVLDTAKTAGKQEKGRAFRGAFMERGSFKAQTLRGVSPWRTAAVSALAAVAVICILWGVRAKSNMASSQSVASSVTTYATRNGERADVTLPDGSAVLLGVASRLDVPTNFGHGTRTLQLHGEAMFTVAHHTGTPFTVQSGAVATRVLGTTFLVRNYPGDSATVVAVHDGKVAVRSAIVTAWQRVAIDPSGYLHLQQADSATFGLATGTLTLNWVPMPQAIVELDRWYDVDIRMVGTTLQRRRLKGAFTAGSVTDLADMLAFALDARVERNGRVLTLYPRV